MVARTSAGCCGIDKPPEPVDIVPDNVASSLVERRSSCNIRAGSICDFWGECPARTCIRKGGWCYARVLLLALVLDLECRPRDRGQLGAAPSSDHRLATNVGTCSRCNGALDGRMKQRVGGGHPKLPCPLEK